MEFSLSTASSSVESLLAIDEVSEGRNLLLVVAGPAGSGKTTLCQRLMSEFSPGVERVITSTTRPPRKGERHGEHYYFFSQEQFERLVQEGQFYEHARIFGNHYGTLKSAIQEKLEEGIDLLINIDVQGVASYHKAAESNVLLSERLVTVFIEPKDIEQLRERLDRRGLDAKEAIRRRLRTAHEEWLQAPNFDYRFTSGSRDADYEKLREIYLREKYPPR